MPKRILIHNQTHPKAAPLRARYCDSFLCRMRGLMFRRGLPGGDSLLLVQSRDSRLDSSIHMLFMFMDLAAVWIDSAYQVVDVQRARAWRPAYWSQAPARYVLETSPDYLGYFAVGDRLDFEEEARS